jgi:hypothetical protein
LHNLTNFADDNLIIKAQQPYAGACCWPWEEPRGHHQMARGLRLLTWRLLDQPQITIELFN